MSNDTIGSLGRDARQFVEFAGDLVGRVPRPEREWQWGDVDLERSHLCHLNSMGLIERVDRDRRTWRATRQLVTAVSDYADVDEAEVTNDAGAFEAGGQATLGDVERVIADD